MAGGLAALLDDVALIAKTAAANIDDVAAAAGKTSAKAAGVVVDDTAVTPQFVRGVTPARELPIIWKITKGSLFNKLLIILPVALLLSWAAPWALTPILMVGGTYLSYEGAEKVWEMLPWSNHTPHEQKPAKEQGQQSEEALVKGAVMTDLILSAEIMVISLNEVAHEPFWERTIVLIVVALLITVGVYGFVGFLVKIDDIGMRLAKRPKKSTKKFGQVLVTGMPKILNTIAFIGTFAMLWVGGHIMLVGVAELFWAAPEHFVHHLMHAVHDLPGVGGLLAWCVETVASMIIGALWGGLVLAIVNSIKAVRGKSTR